MTTAQQRRPLRRRFWFDPRFAIGVGLVVVSLVGVWLVVRSATESTPVYAAPSTLSVGDTVRTSDLVIRHVRLGEAGERYLTDGAIPDDGLVITRTVLEGELVPHSAVGTAAEVSVSPIVIESNTSLPAAVAPGALVDAWASALDENGEYGPPAVVVSRASVVRVVQEDGLVSQGGTRVEILVPSGKIAAVLASIARGDAVSIVPAAG